MKLDPNKSWRLVEQRLAEERDPIRRRKRRISPWVRYTVETGSIWRAWPRRS